MGFEPEGAWQGAGGALQPEAARVAAQVESHPLRHNSTVVLIELPCYSICGIIAEARLCCWMTIGNQTDISGITIIDVGV